MVVHRTNLSIKSKLDITLLKVQNNKIDKSISELKDALIKNPNDLNKLTLLAEYYSLIGQYDNAIFYLKMGQKINPDNSGIYYNIACIYSKQNNQKESLIYLKLALSKGFNDLNLIKADPDLINIRNSSYVVELLKKH
jgi:tetratricopeptide (TPR) repeat protein